MKAPMDVVAGLGRVAVLDDQWRDCGFCFRVSKAEIDSGRSISGETVCSPKAHSKK